MIAIWRSHYFRHQQIIVVDDYPRPKHTTVNHKLWDHSQLPSKFLCGYKHFSILYLTVHAGELPSLYTLASAQLHFNGGGVPFVSRERGGISSWLRSVGALSTSGQLSSFVVE